MDFSYLFCNGKSDGPGPRRMDRAAQLGSTVDRGARGQEGAAAPWWRAGATAHWCSPTAVEEDEPDEAVLEGYSPEHERRRRGADVEAKNGDGLSSARG
jgi:hypothetical protein